jgi:DNA replication protein DnaC
MRAAIEHIDAAAVREHCRTLKLSTVASSFERLATEAGREPYAPTTYLATVLSAEVEERERRAIERRLREAHLPRVKTIEEFDFSTAPTVSPVQVRELAEGGYIERAEPVILIGDCGTGKTHLATALCVAACRQRRRVRFTTAAGLINELVEAQHHNKLGRALQRWARYEVIAIDEVGYVPFTEVSSELIFQILADRAEKSTFILTTNLSFSEWTSVFPNARLCRAILDRVTDRAAIIDTGKESYRFRRTRERQQRKG